VANTNESPNTHFLIMDFTGSNIWIDDIWLALDWRNGRANVNLNITKGIKLIIFLYLEKPLQTVNATLHFWPIHL
jgi:hypothetical protein